MGSSEKFCLRWNDFEANVSRSFAGIRDHNQFFDCTLTTDDDEAYSDNLRAHKVILSACSEFFRNILTKESMSAHPNPLIYLRGISAQDMKYILDFMYHGEVNVAQEELDKFLEVAETLKIKGLTQGSNGSRQASKRPAASSAVSSSPSPGEPRKKPKMHSAVTPSTPSSAPKTEAEVSVKTETGPSVPVGAEDFEESVGGEDDYGGGGDEDYGEDFEGEYEGDDDGAVAGPSGGGGGESGGGGAGGATKGLEALLVENTRPTPGGHWCIICSKVLKGRTGRKESMDNIRSHFVDLHWSEAPSYTCYGKQPKCQRVWQSRNAFKVHLSKNHPELKGVPLDTFINKSEEII